MKKLLLAGAALVALASAAYAQGPAPSAPPATGQGSNRHITIGEVLRYQLTHQPKDGLANFSTQFKPYTGEDLNDDEMGLAPNAAAVKIGQRDHFDPTRPMTCRAA